MSSAILTGPTTGRHSDGAWSTAHTWGAEYRTPADAVKAAATGTPVVILDGGHATLVVAAACATPTVVARMVRLTSGVLCAAMPDALADHLRLPPMPRQDPGTRLPGACVTIDAADGVTTGISARDRSRCLRLLADPATTPAAFVRPGHVIPLRVRAGETTAAAAALTLVTMACDKPVAVLAHLLTADGVTAAGPNEARATAARHGFPLLAAADLRRLSAT